MAVCEVGALEELWRYPVKSMLGERIARATVDELGIRGDRRLALIDGESGKVASAKAPRLWRELLQCSAVLADDEGAARISLPDAEPFWSTDGDVDERLSSFIGRRVRLSDTPPADAELDRSVPDEVLRAGIEAEVEAAVVRIGSGSPGGTFVDFAPLHLITTSTLDRIGELSARDVVEQRRYRPNLVLRTSEPGFVENDWFGREMRIGADLRLKVIAMTPRCAIPTLAHGASGRDTTALRTLAEHNRVVPLPGLGPEPCAGIYAQVMTPGRIESGDKVLVSVD